MRAWEAGRDEPAVHGPVGEVQVSLLDQGLGEMLVIEAGIGRPSPAEDPVPEGVVQAVVRRPAAVPMRQGAGAIAAEGGQQSTGMAQREAQEFRGI